MNDEDKKAIEQIKLIINSKNNEINELRLLFDDIIETLITRNDDMKDWILERLNDIDKS